MRRLHLTALPVLAMTATALADPPTRPPQRAGLRPSATILQRPAARAPAPPPAPIVPVQLTGLRAGTGRAWAAMMHAVQRDAWVAFHACIAPATTPRAVVHVELAPQPNRAPTVRVTMSPRRDVALEACVRRAAARIVVPPREEDVVPAETSPTATETSPETPATPEDLVVFDLAYGMPRLTRR